MTAESQHYSFSVEADAAHFIGMPENNGLFYFYIVCYAPDGGIYKSGDIYLEPDEAFGVVSMFGERKPSDFEYWTKMTKSMDLAPTPIFH